MGQRKGVPRKKPAARPVPATPPDHGDPTLPTVPVESRRTYYHVKFDEAKRKKFLDGYQKEGNFTLAARSVDMHPATVRWWAKKDVEFGELVEAAREIAVARLEKEARRRAVSGWNEPIMYQGARVGSVRKFDSNLLMFLLRGEMPGKYGNRSEVNVNARITLERPDLSSVSDADLEVISKVVERAGAAKQLPAGD